MFVEEGRSGNKRKNEQKFDVKILPISGIALKCAKIRFKPFLC